MGLRFLEWDERISYIAEAMEVYKKAGIGLVRDLYKKGKRPAVIVVDLQEAFVSPDAIMGAKGLDQEMVQIINGAVENTGILLKAVREKGFPIIYSTIAFREDGTDSGTWGERNPSLVEYCKRGTRWVEVDKRIAPQTGDYRIEKRVPSAFIGTPLHQILAYASLYEANEVTATLVYPLRSSTFAALQEQHRDCAVADLLHGGRHVRLELRGLPFGVVYS